MVRNFLFAARACAHECKTPPRPGLRENVDDENLPVPNLINPDEENEPKIVPCEDRGDEYKCDPDNENPKPITKPSDEYEEAYDKFCKDGNRKECKDDTQCFGERLAQVKVFV